MRYTAVIKRDVETSLSQSKKSTRYCVPSGIYTREFRGTAIFSPTNGEKQPSQPQNHRIALRGLGFFITKYCPLLQPWFIANISLISTSSMALSRIISRSFNSITAFRYIYIISLSIPVVKPQTENKSALFATKKAPHRRLTVHIAFQKILCFKIASILTLLIYEKFFGGWKCRGRKPFLEK